jgi:hypothetical protein
LPLYQYGTLKVPAAAANHRQFVPTQNSTLAAYQQISSDEAGDQQVAEFSAFSSRTPRHPPFQRRFRIIHHHKAAATALGRMSLNPFCILPELPFGSGAVWRVSPTMIGSCGAAARRNDWVRRSGTGSSGQEETEHGKL